MFPPPPPMATLPETGAPGVSSKLPRLTTPDVSEVPLSGLPVLLTAAIGPAPVVILRPTLLPAAPTMAEATLPLPPPIVADADTGPALAPAVRPLCFFLRNIFPDTPAAPTLAIWPLPPPTV